MVRIGSGQWRADNHGGEVGEWQIMGGESSIRSLLPLVFQAFYIFIY